MNQSIINRIPERWDRWIIALLGGLFFLPGLGKVHLFDWDEINFAECAREMIASGNFLQVQINFLPFWEKPPLFFWMQVASMKLFGINEFAARFPNAVAGILSLLLLYYLGKKIWGRQFGWIWALLYLGSILPHLYFRSGIIDPWFNLFIFLGLVGWIKATYQKTTKYRWAILGGGALGLAILTKGPVAILITGLVILIKWLFDRFKNVPSLAVVLLFGSTALVVPMCWFGLEYLQNGPGFFREFITYQIRLLSTEDAGHGGFFGYHFVVLLLGCFPASTLGIRAFFRGGMDTTHQWHSWMRILFWVVLILFSIVESKIVHYSSLCYYPLTFLAAMQIHQWIKEGTPIPRLERILTYLIGIIWASACIALPILGMHPEWLQELAANDPFALANLEAEVVWSYGAVFPGILLLGVLVLFLRKSFTLNRFLGLTLGIALFVTAALYCFINRIEGYSQRAVIEFYEEHAEEDAYFQPMGYKSYAHLWYARIPADLPTDSKSKDWLLRGEIDRPVYFITKVHKQRSLAEMPQLQKVWEENGFVVFKRE